jgi:hypothetical protein
LTFDGTLIVDMSKEALRDEKLVAKRLTAARAGKSTFAMQFKGVAAIHS